MVVQQSATCSEVSEPMILPSKIWEKSHLVFLSKKVETFFLRFSIAGFLVPAPQLLPHFSKWCRSKQCPSCGLNPNVVDPMAPLTAQNGWLSQGFPLSLSKVPFTKTAPPIRVPSNCWNFQLPVKKVTKPTKLSYWTRQSAFQPHEEEDLGSKRYRYGGGTSWHNLSCSCDIVVLLGEKHFPADMRCHTTWSLLNS